jgi:hypothetical protein
MTNDNARPKPLKERLRMSILMAIGMCEDAGLPPHEIREVVEKIAEDLREEAAAVDRGEKS